MWVLPSWSLEILVTGTTLVEVKRAGTALDFLVGRPAGIKQTNKHTYCRSYPHGTSANLTRRESMR